MLDAAGHPINENTFNSPKVLIVDDDELTLEVIAMMASRLGHTVHLARDGQEAVELFEASPESFALVIMDVEMPRLDGLQAAHRIREINPSAKLILISGNTKKDVWKVKPNAFVLKSLMHMELKDLVVRLTQPEAPAQRTTAEHPEANGPDAPPRPNPNAPSFRVPVSRAGSNPPT
jgi:CheY-like chemotaxis protein